MGNVSYYTPEGYAKLKAELEHMKTVERAHVIKQIAEARDKGDLSENAEYDARASGTSCERKEIPALSSELTATPASSTVDLD